MAIIPGDPAPGFRVRASNNPRYHFDVAAGRNLVLCFCPARVSPAPWLASLAESPLFDDAFAALYLVVGSEAEAQQLPLRIPGIRAFFDEDGAIAALYGLDRFEDRPITFLISPRMQLLGIVNAPAETHAEAVLAALAGLPDPQALPPLLAHAPVMIIPHVFERSLCERLIAGYRTHGGEASGFMREIDGKTVLIRDPDHKIRADWTIPESDTDLTGLIQNRIMRRVVPEIKKVFQFEVTRMERYIVARYGAEEGGHFRAHRDNTTLGTAHRRFAVSLNLNAEDYEGGDLVFPEFGDRAFRPPTGGVCVFSCSLLHMATRVTRGERFAFLPFLYDEAARRVREANLGSLDLDANAA